jgi:katanin p80 WD40 repeat-containing subunit B1
MTEDNPYKLHEFVAHSTQVNCVTIGPQSIQVLATGGEDSKVNIWRIDNALNIWTLKQNKSSIESLCFDNDEQYLCSGAMNGSLKIFDLNEGKLARNLRGHQVNVTSIHYHPYGEFIVSGSYDNSMKVWDIRNKSCVQTYTGHDREVTCTKFSPDGRWVSSSSKDGQLLIWDLVAGKLLKTIKLAQNAYLTSFEFNPCEFLLAGATSNRSVSLHSLSLSLSLSLSNFFLLLSSMCFPPLLSHSSFLVN